MAIITLQSSVGFRYVEILPATYHYGPEYPLVIFLCGQDGKRSPEYLMTKEIPAELQAWADLDNLIILAPYTDLQFSKQHIDTMLAVGSKLGCNERKIITGLSFGGGAVWNLLSVSLEMCNQFTAAIVVSGIAGVTGCAIALSNLPVLAFHAIDDAVVNISYTRDAIKKINACLPKMSPISIELPNGNHWIWGKVYNHLIQYSIEGKSQSVVEWAISKQKRLSTVAQSLFIVKAPDDFTTPKRIIHLKAEVKGEDWDREKASWKVVEAPSGINIWSPMVVKGGGWIDCEVVLPKPGKYILEVCMTSVSGQVGQDSVTIVYEYSKPVTEVVEWLGKTYLLYQDFTWELVWASPVEP